MIMSNIDWKEKLSSRKLWLGIITVVIGAVLCATGDATNGMTLIKIGSVSYIGAECIVDVARSIFGGFITVIPDEFDAVEEVGEEE